MATTAPGSPTLVPSRDAIPTAYTWDLSAIFPSWEAWDAGAAELERRIDAARQFEGTLADGAPRLLAAFAEQDGIGQLAYRVWYYASLTHDQDQRDNAVGARRQRVQLLLARL